MQIANYHLPYPHHILHMISQPQLLYRRNLTLIFIVPKAEKQSLFALIKSVIIMHFVARKPTVVKRYSNQSVSSWKYKIYKNYTEQAVQELTQYTMRRWSFSKISIVWLKMNWKILESGVKNRLKFKKYSKKVKKMTLKLDKIWQEYFNNSISIASNIIKMFLLIKSCGIKISENY